MSEFLIKRNSWHYTLNVMFADGGAWNFDDWLEMGIKYEWISPPFCNTHDGDNYMTEEEMKEFDGDIIEPPHLSEDLPAPNVTDVENTLLEEEKAFAKAFDPEAVCALADLLGDCFILV